MQLVWQSVCCPNSTYFDFHACVAACCNPLRAAQVEYSANENMMLPIGFLAILQACRRLKRHGHAWFGVPCSTFIWISRGGSSLLSCLFIVACSVIHCLWVYLSSFAHVQAPQVAPDSTPRGDVSWWHLMCVYVHTAIVT